MSKLLVFAGQLALTAEQAAVVMPVLMTPGAVVRSHFEGTKTYYVEETDPVSVFHLPDSDFPMQVEWEARKAAQATIPHGQENS